MLLTRYRHRLPADHHMEAVRARVRARAPAWDDVPGLACKAFVVEERDRGAAENAYSSLYLWLDAKAAVDFLTGPGFRAVVEGFGRPRIETWLALSGRLGRAESAAGLEITERPLPLDADLATVRAEEAAHAQSRAAEPGVRAAVTGLDVAAWRLTRFTLRAGAAGEAEIVHLAAPGLAALRAADGA